jgi:hypothetical protein
MTKPFTLVQSKKKNRYVVDKKTKKITLCHPLIYYFLELRTKKTDIAEWIQQIPAYPIEIPGCGNISRQEIDYYYQKYLFLETNGHFDSPEKDEPSTSR